MMKEAKIVDLLRRNDEEAWKAAMVDLNQSSRGNRPSHMYFLEEAARNSFIVDQKYKKSPNKPIIFNIIEHNGDDVANIDLLEALIYLSDQASNSREIAVSIIARFATLGSALAAAPKELLCVPGVTNEMTRMLKAVHFTLSFVLREPMAQRLPITSASALIDYLGVSMKHQKVETLRILFLDKKNGLLSDQELQRGTVDHAPLYPREIVSCALREGASAVLLAHNHPSGDPTPSAADIQTTLHVQKALNIMGIDLYDHIILASSGYVSMRSEGHLPAKRAFC